jgi:succinate dehydrogenase / fumarate reductase membrane anchor subunit
MTTLSEPTTGPVTHRQVKLQTNFERYAFLFMRLSGVALLILAVGHMVIQHVLNSTANLTLQFVAEQWSSWGWKAYDMLLLAFAMSHGVNGLRLVLEDYIHSRDTIKVINTILAVFLVITIVWAGIAIALFDATRFLGAN